jgi:ankyrin repeat protein
MFSQKNIFDVARSGSVEELKELIAINPDTINAINEHGYTPLTLAAYNANDSVALYLVDKVKDINGNSKYGTPLAAAIFKGRKEVVKVLLEAKANPNIADTNGSTPLHYAIIIRDEDMIEMLVDAKADVSAKDNRGKSALDYAEMTKNENIILLLNKN